MGACFERSGRPTISLLELFRFLALLILVNVHHFKNRPKYTLDHPVFASGLGLWHVGHDFIDKFLAWALLVQVVVNDFAHELLIVDEVFVGGENRGRWFIDAENCSVFHH